MERKYHYPRILAILLLLVTGINATVAGFLFVLSPDGSLMGLSVSLLQLAPFDDYLIPGMILLIVNGIFNLIVAYLTIFKKKHHSFLVSIQGIFLVGWIVIQMGMLREVNGLHLLMLSVGILLIGCGMLIHPKNYRKH